MTQKVGRITVAVGLIGFGVAILLDNLGAAEHGIRFMLKLWPLLLIGFGLEYLIRSFLMERAKAESKLRFDWGGATLLFLVVVLSFGVTTVQTILTDPGHFSLPWGMGPSISETKDWTIPTAGVKELVADVDVGAVTIQEHSRADEIRVEATYIANGFAADRSQIQSELDNIKMNLEQGPTVKLKPEIDPHLNDVSVRFVIYAPPGLTIKASTGTGLIDVTGYKGNLELDSRVGRIAVQASSGTLTAASDSGMISVRSFEGPVSAKASVGSLSLTDVNGPIQLDSGTGMLTVQDFRGGKLVAESRMGAINANTRFPLEGDVALKTQNGSVYLAVPSESSMRVTAQTRTGGITVPPFMAAERNGTSGSAIGTNRDGKYTVTLEANTGSVGLRTSANP